MKKIPAVIAAAALTLSLPTAAFAGTLSSVDALGIALDDAGLSAKQVVRVDTELERGIFEVEFTQKQTKTEFEYDIRANDGKIVEKDVDYAYKHTRSKAKIGKRAAVKKVAKFSGVPAKVVASGKCTYKYKKHEGTYKVKFRHGEYKYEYKVLAPTGKVIEWEMEARNK